MTDTTPSARLDHQHLLVNLVVRKPFVDPAATVEWLRRLVAAVGMKVVIGPHAHYCTADGNNGITAAACIETSHLSLHCWDQAEIPYARFDLYSCAAFNPEVVFASLRDMDPVSGDYLLVDRNGDLAPSAVRPFPV